MTPAARGGEHAPRPLRSQEPPDESISPRYNLCLIEAVSQMGYETYGVIYIADLEGVEDPYSGFYPGRSELNIIAAVLQEVGIITSDERARLHAQINDLEEDPDSGGLLFTDRQCEFGEPIQIPYHVKSEAAFPYFHSTSLIGTKWGELGNELTQFIEVHSRDRPVSPTGAIPDRTYLYLARVHYEGTIGNIDRKLHANKILNALCARVNSAFHIPPGSVRIAVIAV